MAKKEYEIIIEDHGEKGDLENGWGYDVYLNNNGKKNFRGSISIYEFDSHIIIGQREKTKSIAQNPETKKWEGVIKKEFPIGIKGAGKIEEAEERAHNYAVDCMAKGLMEFLQLSNSKLIDNTGRGKTLKEKIKPSS